MGNYRDAREAAYVVGLYRKDPINTIREVQSRGEIDSFPEDLYNLPEGLAYEKAVQILNSQKANKKVKVSVVSKADPATTIAFGNLIDFFKREDYVPIAKSLGGMGSFETAIKGMTILDFSKKFDVPLI